MSDESNTPKSNTSIGLPDEIEKLKLIFPQFVKDGKIDFDSLKNWFSENGQLPEKDEKYNLGWAGRSTAIQATRTPATGTLTPSKEESRDWENTKNLFIEGDNLEVLKLLQRQYSGKVKMIYIDPPYNTGKDFVYSDKFSEGVSDYYNRYGKTSTSNEAKNQQAAERYHSNWLSMMYPRLYLAKTLLSDNGSIIVSIDDNEVYNLRQIMNEIFGENNFVGQIIWQRKYSPQNDAKTYSPMHEYLVVFARNVDKWKLQLLPRSTEARSKYKNPDNDPRGDWKPGDLTSKTKASGHSYKIVSPSGKEFLPTKGRQWAPSKLTFDRLLAENRIWFGPNDSNVPALKQFLNEVQDGVVPGTLWLRDEVGDNQSAVKELQELDIPFDSPKPTRLLRQLLLTSSSKESNDIILDFFGGSGTLGDSVMRLNAEDGGNRRWITVQLQENTDEKSDAFKAGFGTISKLALERIRRAGDRVISTQGKQKDVAPGSLDIGFKVFKLTPSNYRKWHQIANNETVEVEILRQSKLIADNPLIDTADPLSIIFEVALKEGFDITVDPEDVKIGNMNCSMFVDADGDRKLYVTLGNEIDDRAVIRAKLKQNDIFVCLDNSFKSSSQKLNLTENGVNLKVI